MKPVDDVGGPYLPGDLEALATAMDRSAAYAVAAYLA
jgi:hypothetical protein